MEQGEVVFEKLKRSEAYVPTAHETLKRDIFLKFWLKAAPNLSKRFGPAGKRTDELGSEQNGFGFLIEKFAQLSRKVPKNSEESEHIADLILHACRNGDNSFFPVNIPRSNPDVLWIESSGKRVEIAGIGEIKASVEAYLMTFEKRDQLALQERTIRRLVELIQKDSASRAFQDRKFKIREPLRKALIAPAGSKESFLKRLPAGWEVLELEFSYDEFIFIGQQLWPGFRKEKVFGEGTLGKFQKFLETFLSFKGPRVRWLLKKTDNETFPAEEIVMFMYATRRLPIDDNDIALIASAMNGWRREFVSFPETILQESDFTKKEQEIFSILSAVPTQHCHEPLIFLSHLRIFAENLLHGLKRRKDGSAKRVRRMAKCEELF